MVIIPLRHLIPVGLLASALAHAEEPLDYAFDVQPILSENCFHCHGPDNANQKAGLRLDLREAALEDYVIVPGDPDSSEAILRIFSDDLDDLMPPPESHRVLSEEDKKILERWVKEGAVYEGHWAFQSLEPITPPEPAPGATVKNPIDQFVSAALSEEGHEQQPEARKETLLRRVTFDITGLPPTPEEVIEFLADDSPDAYEKVVNELLSRPTWGERMATPWLDVARYADSYGFQVDRERPVWPWRDWVIRAFNDNLPYDQFITWQLAGDLLPDATRDQKLATAFNRLHQQESEGGSVEEEYRVEYVADRTQTFGTAFMGLTLECARCHDHKYDPISQKDYFQFFAFFDDIDESGLYSYFTPTSVPTPALTLPTEDQEQQLPVLKQAILKEEQKLAKLKDSRKAAFATWKKDGLSKIPATVDSGLLAHFAFDGFNGGKFPNLADPETKPATTTARSSEAEGKIGKAVQLTGDDAVKTELGNFTRHQPFSVSLWIWNPEVKERTVLFHRSRAWTDAASRGYELLLKEGKPTWSLIHFWPGNAISVQAKDAVPAKEWVHLTVTYDGSSTAEGMAIYVNGSPADISIERDKLTKNITGGGGDHITIGERFRDRGFRGGRVDEFRVFDRELTAMEVAQEAGQPASSPSEAEAYAWYLAHVDEAWQTQLGATKTAREAHAKVADGVSEIMVMQELPEPKTAYVLNRGAYDNRGEPVEANTPEALPPMPEDAPQNRLGLAQWLTSPEQPLTSRVAVNQIWQMAFGNGLVATPEDFGSQGDRPEYPQLLDWLAGEFMAGGWNVKQLMRTIVTSHTYRQQSIADSSLMKNDPHNRLLARGPRHRLPAEMIRDNALAASGLLVEKIGGPPVKPYDVTESFKPVAAGEGDELYRRSVYTWWKRTAPSPAMEAFDAVKRDVCSVERETTSTPLQALVLLNGPQFVEASRVLGEKAWKETNGNLDEALHHIFLTMTSRAPSDREMAVLKAMYDEQEAHFQANPKDAEAFLSVGAAKADADVPTPTLAALGVVSKALLNFDESVVKR